MALKCCCVAPVYGIVLSLCACELKPSLSMRTAPTGVSVSSTDEATLRAQMADGTLLCAIINSLVPGAVLVRRAAGGRLWAERRATDAQRTEIDW
eukprot:256517-Chlamydomonas_euryale.AAC.6